MTGSIPQPLSFLEAVSGHLDRARTSSADRPVRLALVDPAYNPFVAPYPNGPTPPCRVTFEGESTLSTKAYAVADGFIPRPGRRVFMIPQGNGYLVAGALGGQSPQGFWADADGSDYGMDLGAGNYWDTTDGLVLEGDATIQGILQVGGRRGATGPGAGKLHWASYTVTTDASGMATATHGAGFTPTFVLVGQAGSAGTSGAHIIYMTGTAGATTFQVKILNASGAAFASGTAVAISAIMGA